MNIPAAIVFIAALVLAVLFEITAAWIQQMERIHVNWPIGFFALCYWATVTGFCAVSGILPYHAHEKLPKEWVAFLVVGFLHTAIRFFAGDEPAFEFSDRYSAPESHAPGNAHTPTPKKLQPRDISRMPQVSLKELNHDE